MTGSNYTIGQFYQKVDYEGGWEDAVFYYGLDETDLAEQHGEFYDLVKELAELRVRVTSITDRLNELGEEAFEDEIDEDD